MTNATHALPQFGSCTKTYANHPRIAPAEYWTSSRLSVYSPAAVINDSN